MMQNTFNIRTLTPQEALTYHGRLEENHIEEVLEALQKVDKIGGLGGPLEDARASYPSEDFLGLAIDMARDFVKNCRGANRGKAQELVQILEDIQQDTRNASEYGREEIDKVMESI